MEITSLPITCPCESKFDIQHSISCKKDGFISIRRIYKTSMMSEKCKEIKTESKLAPLFGEELQGRTSNNSTKAKVDIRTRGFWGKAQQE